MNGSKSIILLPFMNVIRTLRANPASTLRSMEASLPLSLHGKLDGFPFVELTQQIMEAKAARSADDGLVKRLVHGRLTLLNSSMNLMQALDAIFVLSEDDLRNEVRDACAIYGHTPSQIELQLAEMEEPLYSYVPQRLLAQRNMLVMNKLGVNVMKLPTDRPGERSWKVAAPTEPISSFAVHTILFGFNFG